MSSVMVLLTASVPGEEALEKHSSGNTPAEFVWPELDNETELQEFWERASSWVQEMESDWGEMTGTGASSFCRAAQ